MKFRQKYSKQGFTLIELLIVVAIIAIIAAIAVPSMLKAFYLSKDKKVVSEMRNFAVAIGIYRIDYEMVPNAADITELVQVLQDTTPANENTNLSPKDAWGHELYYRRMAQDEYTLKSFGRDGGESDPANTDLFDPDADTIITSGVFKASHQGTTSIVGH
jgi:general secretion pathway protein G